MVDELYTTDDHAFRESDEYARAKYDMTLRWLGPADGRTLRNVGCGNGLFNELAIAAGFRVEACEPDPVAHALAASATPAIEVHLGGLLDVAWAEAPADVLVMHDVLEHIEDERGAVDHLADLLRDGGRAIISVPALPALYGHHDELLGHFRRYTRRTLTGALARRLTVTRMRYYGLTFIPITTWYSKVRRRPYPTASVAGPSLVGRAFAGVCGLEGRVPTPIGTSLVCEAVKRSASTEVDP